jgi:hypothetical protein
VIHVVIGHICSGKSTFVRSHASGDDVVIDMDRIALALSVEGTRHHEYTNEIRDIARLIRWHAIDRAVRLHAFKQVPNVWIIHAYPSSGDMGVYRRIAACIRHMDADPDTLRSRAMAERPERMRAELERQLSLAAGAT